MADSKFDDLTAITDLQDGDVFAVSRAGALGSRKITKAALIPALTPSGVGAGWLFDAHALVQDQKASLTNGGTFTSGAWRTRDLNTEVFDAKGIVSLPGSNRFTLVGGRSYFLDAQAPAYAVSRHQAKLVQDPAGTPFDALWGTSEYDHVSGGSMSLSRIVGVLSPVSDTAYEVQHRCETTATNYGFGVGDTLATGGPCIYTQVFVWRYA